MKRSRRALCATVWELEKRALQARAPLAVAPPPVIDSVGFTVPDPSTPGVLMQQVTQQSGVVTVSLARNSPNIYSQPLQVQVTTDRSSPYVGVNIGEVNQTVTFAPEQSLASLTVPIIAGAPNPGEVDVYLTITPIDPPPDLTVSPPLELRVMASDALLPPRIIAENGTPNGIVLTFNKPMDPVQASNVKNYAVYSTTLTDTTGGLLGWVMHGPRGKIVRVRLPLKSAHYDDATKTVTLITGRRLTYYGGISVSEGHPPHRAKSGANAAHGLVDLQGNPINQATTPGKFRVVVSRGFTPFYSA